MYVLHKLLLAATVLSVCYAANITRVVGFAQCIKDRANGKFSTVLPMNLNDDIVTYAYSYRYTGNQVTEEPCEFKKEVDNSNKTHLTITSEVNTTDSSNTAGLNPCGVTITTNSDSSKSYQWCVAIRQHKNFTFASDNDYCWTCHGNEALDIFQTAVTTVKFPNLTSTVQVRNANVSLLVVRRNSSGNYDEAMTCTVGDDLYLQLIMTIPSPYTGLTCDKEGETAEVTSSGVVTLQNNKLKPTTRDIDIAHRMGKLDRGKPRSVIVKLVQRQTKITVIKNAKLFKEYLGYWGLIGYNAMLWRSQTDLLNRSGGFRLLKSDGCTEPYNMLQLAGGFAEISNDKSTAVYISGSFKCLRLFNTDKLLLSTEFRPCAGEYRGDQKCINNCPVSARKRRDTIDEEGTRVHAVVTIEMERPEEAEKQSDSLSKEVLIALVAVVCVVFVAVCIGAVFLFMSFRRKRTNKSYESSTSSRAWSDRKLPVKY